MIKLRKKGVLRPETDRKLGFLHHSDSNCECKRKALEGNSKSYSSEHRNGKKAKWSYCSPEVGQAQLQLLPGFISGDVVGGRTSFILGEENQFSISNGCSGGQPLLDIPRAKGDFCSGFMANRPRGGSVPAQSLQLLARRAHTSV